MELVRLGRQHGGDGQRKDQRRHGEEDVRDAHNHRVNDCPLEVAGNHAQGHADGHNQCQHHHAHQQGEAEAEDYAAEDIAPELICAEQIYAVRRRFGVGEIGKWFNMTGEGRHIRRKNGQQDDDDDHRQADDGEWIAREFVPGAADVVASVLALVCAPVLGGIKQCRSRLRGHFSHAQSLLAPRRRMRGSKIPTTRSTRIFTTMKVTPSIRITAAMAFRSLRNIAWVA